MSMSQRSIAAYTTIRPYDSRPFRSHAWSEFLSGAPSVASFTFDDAVNVARLALPDTPSSTRPGSLSGIGSLEARINNLRAIPGL